ncbi:MAG TPA: HAD family hydrolase [Candidatus Dojkabacteria bacterium]|nr:HAD family hydrolase [Candidatus Dojkabacteria bacterium]
MKKIPSVVQCSSNLIALNMKYKYLFTDLDDTLFDSSSLYEGAVFLAWQHFRKFHPEIDLDLFKNTFLEVRTELKEKYKYTTLSHQRAILFMRLLEKFNISFDASLVLQLHDIYWFTVNTYIQPFPHTYEVLQKVRDNGIGVLALSDGTIVDRLEKIDAVKLSPYIDLLVASEEVIDTKPKSAVFELALQKSGCEKKDVIFLGNSFKADVFGGESFGIDTIWMNKEEEPIPKDMSVTPDYIIKDIQEILPILGIE